MAVVDVAGLLDSMDHEIIDSLLTSVGRGDQAAFALFYDHTAAGVFGLLAGALGMRVAAESTGWVYRFMWRTAPDFDRATTSAWEVLMLTTRRELAAQLCGRHRGLWLVRDTPSFCIDKPAVAESDD